MIIEKAQLAAEVAAFVEKINGRPGRKQITPKEQTDLFDLWERISKERVYCGGCSAIVAETFKNVEEWAAKNPVEKSAKKKK